jgi:hypothetical protein
MAPRTTPRRPPRWEIVVRVLAALLVLLLIAYGVAWFLGYLRPGPRDLGVPAAPVFTPADQTGQD